MELIEDIKEVSKTVKNKNRFHKIKGHKSVWYYDSFSHSMYSIDKKLLEKVEKSSGHENLVKNLSLEECTKLFNFCNVIKKWSKDIVLPVPPDHHCTVMINTSNRCNMSCSYCYRDKDNPNICKLQTIKETLDYATKRYKPWASSFVISYSMTSESSQDLKLLKQVTDEYINYENYQFNKDDINRELFEEFYERLKKDFSGIKLENINFPQKRMDDIITFLNRILEVRNLFDLLELSLSMFENGARWDIVKRDILVKWRLYRANRWCLDTLYDKYLKKRKVPYVTFWFMTNGTCADKEFIDFVKGCSVNPLWVSIDGPKKVHDANRKYIKGKGSYDDVVKNIKIFQENGIDIKASVVLTAYYPKPMAIINHILKLGIKQISMTPVRPGSECSFTKENIDQLLSGYDEVYEMLKQTAENNNFELFRLLKDDIILSAFNIFLNRNKLAKRCHFDDQIVVNSKGEIYPCLYFTDKRDFCFGNIKNGLNAEKLNHDILVNQRGSCKKCWARYLCGGTCFYGSFITTGNYMDIEPVECILKKHLAKRCLELIVFLKEHDIAIEKIYK